MAKRLYHDLLRMPKSHRGIYWLRLYQLEVLIGLETTQPPGALFGLRRLDVAREHWGAGLTPTRERYLGYEATLIAKGLVLKVLGHAGPTQIKMTKEVVIKPELALMQIWPVQSSGGIVLPQSQ